jgi:ubiquinone/menaquinone biosynthesis C-methylase UbiE
VEIMIIKSVINRLLEYTFGSKYQEFIWGSRHLREGNEWININLKNGIYHPHRAILKKAILKYKPETVLEIGCGTGSNLQLLRKDVRTLLGFDINSKAIEIGNTYLKEQGYNNIILSQGKADRLNYEDKSIDLTITDATLLYIAPDKINKVISEIIRVTKKACVFCEWNRNDRNESYYKDHWVHNYEYLFKEYTVNITKIPYEIFSDECWGKYGAIVEVKL